MLFRAIAALAFPFASVALAEGPILKSPINCDLTTTCFIQQYMDHDPGPAAEDFRCAPLSYDTHSGTDFALPSLAMMQSGVDVLAAADGVVIGTRDGMADDGYTAETAEKIKGRECGNGIRLDHGDGWTTQYCHLKRGSISVRNGQKVSAGMRLGHVGMSGRAAFPHLHLSLRKKGQNVDPFDPDGTIDCTAPDQNTLWSPLPTYRPGGIIGIGFADHVPKFDAIKAGTAAQVGLTADAPALVIWSYNFGTRVGDVLHLTLEGPNDTIIQNDITLEKTQAQSFRAIGKKRRNTPWPKGRYIGHAKLSRDGKILEEQRIETTLR